MQAALTGVSPTPPKAVGANKRGGSLASGPTVGSSRRWKRDGDKLYDTQDWRYGVAVSTADVLGAVKTDWGNVPVGTMDACTQKTQAASSAPPKVVTPLFAVSVNDDYIEPEGPDRENSADGKPLPKSISKSTRPVEIDMPANFPEVINFSRHREHISREHHAERSQTRGGWPQDEE